MLKAVQIEFVVRHKTKQSIMLIKTQHIAAYMSSKFLTIALLEGRQHFHYSARTKPAACNWSMRLAPISPRAPHEIHLVSIESSDWWILI